MNIASPGVEGEYNADGRETRPIKWDCANRKHCGDPTGYNTWRTNFGRMAAAASQGPCRSPVVSL